MSYKKSKFENAPKKRANKTRFNLSHEHKSQMLPGYLIPCMRPIETLPGDSFDIQTEFFFRFSPLYFPIMHRITMRADYYYVPLRIMWKKGAESTGWEDWITKQAEIEPPRMDARLAFNTLAFNIDVLSQFGLPLLPVDVGVHETHITNLNAFPLSAYLMCWDWYERIPQLEDERHFNLLDGDNTSLFETAFGVAATFTFPLLSAKWEKDTFTSALPTPQIGGGIQIPVTSDFADLEVTPPAHIVRASSDGSPVDVTTLGSDASGFLTNSAGGAQVYLDVQDTAGTIRQLREAEVLQSFYERIMKIGDRYDDFIDGLWGTTPQPGIINIPVLIGSRFGKVQISDVMTQATNDLAPEGKSMTGDYAGQANLYEGGKKLEYTCNEHGFIICLIQLNANTAYGQGVERLWRRTVQTDYALDMFATIGDQEILKEEILYNSKTTDLLKNQETFGYIDRFAEYKWLQNIHVGVLNFNAGLSQHLGRWWDPKVIVGALYDSTIEINAAFTNSAPEPEPGGHRLVDVFRTLPSGASSVQYPTEGVIYTWFFHSIYVNRALPLYSTPKL